MAQVSNNNVTVVEFKRVRSLIPETWEDSVRTIGISEHKEAAFSLAQAFASDDLARYLMGAHDMTNLSDEARWKLHVQMYKYIVASHCYDGLVTTIGPEYDAVALWMPPGSTEDWFSWIRSGLWRLYYQLPQGGKNRYYKELIPLLHDTKHEVMGDRDDDCYYLVYIGTKPSGRGKGYARKLIEDMAARADAEGRAMYLESTSPFNNAYYAKFGFRYVKDVSLGTPPPPAASPSSSSSASISSSSDEDDDDDKGSLPSPPPPSTTQQQQQQHQKGEPYVAMAIMVREPDPKQPYAAKKKKKNSGSNKKATMQCCSSSVAAAAASSTTTTTTTPSAIMATTRSSTTNSAAAAHSVLPAVKTGVLGI